MHTVLYFEKNSPKRRIIVLGIDDIWRGDLLTMSNYSNQNDNYKYFLNDIDIYSKVACSMPLKRKVYFTFLMF